LSQRKIQRFCWFDTVITYDEGNYPYGTIWKTFRAKEDHKLEIVEIKCAIGGTFTDTRIYFQAYEGEIRARNWGAFPYIFDQSTLGFVSVDANVGGEHIMYLHGYETKSLTMSIRNTNETKTYPALMIVYFYEVKMTKEEILEYAVKQPRFKYPHGSSSTLDRYEDVP